MTAAPPGRERIGAIDVGSNSIRLVVAEYDPETGFEIIDEVKDQPRLGTRVEETRALDRGAMTRAFAALKRMKEVADRRGVTRLAAVATSAMRDARNGEAFARRVERQLGIPLEIIGGDREAQLLWRSVAHHFRLENARTLVADIGGGSLELIGAVDGLVEITASLPLGAVRLTEQFLTSERTTRKELDTLRKHIRKTLRKALPWRDWKQAVVIGSGGSFTNLARIAAARAGHLGNAIHGTTVGTGEVESLLEWLANKSPEQRAQIPGLNPQRADIIVAGVAVAAEMLALLDARELTASAFGLREGVLLEMIGVHEPARLNDPLQLIREFVDRCRGDRRHVEQVRVLAMALYEQLAAALGCGVEDAALLEAAALLHDVGQLVSYRNHHKHSYRLISHADRLGLDSRARALVAVISRYHRKRGPTRKHEEFDRLTPDDRATVRRVSALLRVADGLDRGHTAAVERVAVSIEKGRCVMRVSPRLQDADVSLEVWGATRKADVLAHELECEVVIMSALQAPRAPKRRPDQRRRSRRTERPKRSRRRVAATS
ncbi:MAG TPA: Ppx/GppA phosphatase family protein [Gemmatimonadales bacterium]